MYDSKLIEILRGLKPDELSKIPHFLPFALIEDNTSVAVADVLLLFNQLQAFYPNFDHSELEMSAFFQKCFPNKAFTKPKIGKLLTALTKAIERYMVYQKVTETPFQFNLHLAESYADRFLDHRFSLQIETLQKLPFLFNSKDLLKRYLTEELALDYESLRNARQGDLNLVTLIKSLDVFYLVAQLEYLLGIASQHNLTRLQAFDLINEKLEDIKNLTLRLNLAHNPIIRVYSLGLDVLLKNINYDIFSYELNQASTILNLEQRQMFYTIERSILAKRFNKGDDSVCLPYFNLLKTHLEKGYLHYSGGLMMSSFINVITMGLHAGEYDWVAEFINTYASQLVGTEEKEELVQYHKANLAFHRGQIKEAFRLLPNHKFKDYAYELALRRLEIKIYYELKLDAVDAKLNAFKNYLFEAHRRNLPTDKYEPNNNFVNIVKRMLELNVKTDKANRLKTQLLESGHYTDRNWLLTKLNGYAP